MHRLTFFFVCLLVFVMPAQEELTIERFESGARLLGYVALACAPFAILAQGRMRAWTRTVTFLMLFWAWCMATMAWTINSEMTLGVIPTYTADMLFAWLICEFAGTFKRQIILLWSFILGVSFSVAEMYLAFLTGRGQAVAEDGRYTGGGANQNEMAYLGVLAICVAAYLLSRKIVKFRLGRLYLWGFVPVTALGVLLTGSRGGAIALVAVGGMIFFSLRRTGWGFRVTFIAAVLIILWLIPKVVPEELLKREMEGTKANTFTERQEIWKTAIDRWADSPVLGAGVGCFRRAVWGVSGGLVGHNLYIDVLVEEGAVGLGLFVGAVLAAFYAAWCMPPPDRPFWLGILAVWVLGSMVSPWEYGKLTWFLLSTVASMSAAMRAEAAAARPLPFPAVVAASPYRRSRLGAT